MQRLSPLSTCTAERLCQWIRAAAHHPTQRTECKLGECWYRLSRQVAHSTEKAVKLEVVLQIIYCQNGWY